MTPEQLTVSEPVEIKLVQGRYGHIGLYINGLRVAGHKPWAGGTVVHRWQVTRKEIEEALCEQKS